jgi:hypothetical protein
VTVWSAIANLTGAIASIWINVAALISISRFLLSDDDVITRFLRTIFFELRPFYVPAATVNWVIYMSTHRMDMIDYLGLVFTVIAWFWFRNRGGDDDRWKRRAKKLASKVQARGSRLVVVPVRAS